MGPFPSITNERIELCHFTSPVTGDFLFNLLGIDGVVAVVVVAVVVVTMAVGGGGCGSTR